MLLDCASQPGVVWCGMVWWKTTTVTPESFRCRKKKKMEENIPIKYWINWSKNDQAITMIVHNLWLNFGLTVPHMIKPPRWPPKHTWKNCWIPWSQHDDRRKMYWEKLTWQSFRQITTVRSSSNNTGKKRGQYWILFRKASHHHEWPKPFPKHFKYRLLDNGSDKDDHTNAKKKITATIVQLSHHSNTTGTPI